MSRIGKKSITVPKNAKITAGEGSVTVEGPKGKLEHKLPRGIKISVKDNLLTVENTVPGKENSNFYGLTRAVIANLIKGVTEGYTKELEIRGVGFKAQVQGNTLQIMLGFSHPVLYEIPEGVKVTVNKQTRIMLESIDKVKLGEIAAEIRDFFKPEPYTGKGIRYVGEYVRHKAGKTVVK